MPRNDPQQTIEVTSDVRILIYLDDDPVWTPAESGDDSLFLVADHRNFTVKGVASVCENPRDALCSYDCDEEHEHTADCPREGAIEPSISRDYHVFALLAYIHSGVRLSLGSKWEGSGTDRGWEAPFDPGGWDSSRLGLVFVSRKEWPDDDAAEKAAKSLVDEWNDILSGNVWGYVIERRYRIAEEKRLPDGSVVDSCEFDRWEVEDSCWGFVGDAKYCIEAARNAAAALVA